MFDELFLNLFGVCVNSVAVSKEVPGEDDGSSSVAVSLFKRAASAFNRALSLARFSFALS